MKRHLPLIGYIFLATWVAITFGLEHQHSTDSRNTIAHQTRSVLIAGCERQNVLRLTLQGLILAGIPQTRQYVKDGTLTKAQADRAIASSRDAAHKLATTDCKKAYPVPKTTS